MHFGVFDLLDLRLQLLPDLLVLLLVSNVVLLNRLNSLVGLEQLYLTLLELRHQHFELRLEPIALHCGRLQLLLKRIELLIDLCIVLGWILIRLWLRLQLLLLSLNLLCLLLDGGLMGLNLLLKGLQLLVLRLQLLVHGLVVLLEFLNGHLGLIGSRLLLLDDLAPLLELAIASRARLLKHLLQSHDFLLHLLNLLWTSASQAKIMKIIRK